MCVSLKPSYLSTNPPFPSTYLLIVLPKFLVTNLFHPSHPPWQKKMEWVNTCQSLACNKKSSLHNNDKVNSCNRSNRLKSMMSRVLLECGPNYAQASHLGSIEWKDLHHFSYDTQQLSREKKEQNCGAIQKTEWLHWVHWVQILSFELPHEQQRKNDMCELLSDYTRKMGTALSSKNTGCKTVHLTN